MKKLILLLMLVLPFMANAMKIVTDEVDEFTGNRTVITSWESASRSDVNIRFRLQEGKVFLDFKLQTDAVVLISDGAKLMFKSIEDAITSLNSTSTFTGGRGQGATGIGGSGRLGIFATYAGDISWFKENTIKLIRTYTSEGYIDKNISQKDGQKFIALYKLFNETINN